MSELKKGWYVLRTLTGQEQKVQKLLEAAAIEQGLGDCIGEALVPVERVIRVKNGKKTSVTRKLFPGYVFLEAALYDSEHKIYAPAWSCIRNVQGVIGFLGGDPPHPLSDKEVEDLRGQSAASGEKPRAELGFDVGEKVRITDGPFAGFSGIVQEVDPNRGRLKVCVSIFAREVPTEVEGWQVEKEEERQQPAPGAAPAHQQ